MRGRQRERIGYGGGTRHEIEASYGHRLACFVVTARGTKRGGLVVLQEIFGVTARLKSVALQYAVKGFDIAIPALFDGKRRNAVIPFDEEATGRQIELSLDVSDNLLDIEAAVRFLGEQRNSTVLGFCRDGGLALKCAQGLSLAHAFSFYGTRLAQFRDKLLGAPMLFHFGSKDEHSPPDVISAVTERFPEVEIHVYDAGHAFANDARPGFHAEEPRDWHASAPRRFSTGLCRYGDESTACGAFIRSGIWRDWSRPGSPAGMPAHLPTDG